MSTQTTRWHSRSGAQARRSRPVSGRRAARRHDEAVIQAEVRRLARALRPYGVLHRDALERAAGAEHWRQGGFDSALSAAARSGAIEPLPLGFFHTRGAGARGRPNGERYGKSGGRGRSEA